jgi:hypothetical protein
MAANAVLFIGWGQPVRGRERQALKVLRDAATLWDEHDKTDRLEHWDGVFLDPHGGDLHGFFLLHGVEQDLDAIRRSEAMVELMQRASLIVDGFGVVAGKTGEEFVNKGNLFERMAGALEESFQKQ